MALERYFLFVLEYTQQLEVIKKCWSLCIHNGWSCIFSKLELELARGRRSGLLVPGMSDNIQKQKQFSGKEERKKERKKERKMRV